jgi:E3 ubiquitin-protein ligase CHFR
MKEKEEEFTKAKGIKRIKDDKLKDELTCNICFEIYHKPVSMIPCLHSFCGGCLSDWIKKSKECPFCRKVSTAV